MKRQFTETEFSALMGSDSIDCEVAAVLWPSASMMKACEGEWRRPCYDTFPKHLSFGKIAQLAGITGDRAVISASIIHTLAQAGSRRRSHYWGDSGIRVVWGWPPPSKA